MLNLPRTICKHIVGEKHSFTHRASVGMILIFGGVLLAKIEFEIYLIHVVCDAAGYMIHAIGTIPFLEQLLILREEA